MSGERFGFDLTNLNFFNWDYLYIYEASFFSISNFTPICSFLGSNEARKQFSNDYSEFVDDNNQYNRIYIIDSILCGNEKNWLMEFQVEAMIFFRNLLFQWG